MRHARRPENIPVGALNGVLITHHQRGQHTGEWPVFDALIDGFTHRLADALNRMRPTAGEFDRWRIVRPGSHIAGGLNALLPQPELVVKTMRVAVAMRRLEPHRHAPALAGTQGLRLALQGQLQLGRISTFQCRTFGLPHTKTRIPA